MFARIRYAIETRLNSSGRTGRGEFCIFIGFGTLVYAAEFAADAWFVYLYVLEHLYRSPGVFLTWCKIALAASVLFAQIPAAAFVWRLAVCSVMRRINDIGCSRKLVWLCLLPAVNVLFILALAVLPGKKASAAD